MTCSGTLSMDAHDMRRLISASVGTIVWYGMQCSPKTCDMFLGFCLVMGVAGTILPFCDWFNDNTYRVRASATSNSRFRL